MCPLITIQVETIKRKEFNCIFACNRCPRKNFSLLVIGLPSSKGNFFWDTLCIDLIDSLNKHSKEMGGVKTNVKFMKFVKLETDFRSFFGLGTC